VQNYKTSQQVADELSVSIKSFRKWINTVPGLIKRRQPRTSCRMFTDDDVQKIREWRDRIVVEEAA